MKISYADGGILYIPATQMDLIQKYAGADAKPPKLNKLGTPQWKKTKGTGKKSGSVNRKRSCKTLRNAPADRRLCLWTGYGLAERV